MTTEAGRALRPVGAGATLCKRAFADARVRTIAFAYVFAVYSWLEASGFRSAYPTLADRLAFSRTFAGNDAIRLFYGYPYDVFTVGGYSAWRVGGTLALAAVAFGILAGVRALRTEEEEGRADLVLAAPVSRRTAFGSAVGACMAQAIVLGIAEWLGFVAGRLPVGSSAFLALTTTSVVAVFVAAGALMSQLAATGMGALGLGAGVGLVCWVIRVVSDTATGAAWLRWATPLGWAERARPFAGSDPVVLMLPLLTTAALLAVAAGIARRRDVGVGLLPGRSVAVPNFHLLRTTTSHAVRSQWASLVVWVVGICGSAAVLGMVSTSIRGAGFSKRLRSDLTRLGAGSITTPAGYLALVFMVYIVAIGFFACAQVNSARKLELGGQLEVLLGLPVGRTRWLGGRLVVALAGIAVLAQLAGLMAWIGAASQGARVSLSSLAEAGCNCVTVGVLFLGLAALAYAVLPRAAAVLAYLLVSVSFLWNIVGGLLRAPRWTLDLTPFQHVGLVPAQGFQLTSAVALVLIGAASGGAALVVFRRRDLAA